MSNRSELLGTKESFAIEYVERDNLLGMCYWINGLQVGSLESMGIKGAIVAEISSILKAEELNNPATDLSNIESFITANFDNEELIPAKLFYGVTENFDDFLLLCFRCNNKFIFSWKLGEEPAYGYQYGNYPEGVNVGILNEEEVEGVIKDALTKLKGG